MIIREVLRNLWGDIRAAYAGRLLLLHIAAAAITVVLVLSGADWQFYEMTRSSLWHPLVWIAGIGGFYAPVIFPVAVYLLGTHRRSAHLQRAGISILRAVVAAFIIVAVYKIFTGRVQPEFIYTIGIDDISRQFQFGFLRNGIFWGWPSSHTAVAFAGALTAMVLLRNTLTRALLFVYMFVIAVGAAIGFHWLSDVAAGALVGGAVASALTSRSGRIEE